MANSKAVAQEPSEAADGEETENGEGDGRPKIGNPVLSRHLQEGILVVEFPGPSQTWWERHEKACGSDLADRTGAARRHSA